MLKKIAFAALFGFALITTLPSYASAEKYPTVTGRVTARTATSISVYDKEIVTVAFDDRTTFIPWIQEKPFVRKASYLSSSAVKVGSLVTVRMRAEGGRAELVKVANDVQTTFNGRAVAFNDTSLSVFDKHMAVVTLGIEPSTSFTKMFLVKPWVRKPVHLAPTDLKEGVLVKMFASKTDPTIARRIEVATDEPLFVPPVPGIGNSN